MLTRKQAITLYESRFWETMSYKERAMFQVLENILCMPIEVFQEALKKHLGRPVFTHEFGGDKYDALVQEVFEGAPLPTHEEILALIPQEKLLLIKE